MFYEKSIDAELRFGDVLKGFITITPKIKEPFSIKCSYDNDLNYNDNINYGYDINVNLSFCAVLSPSCSIGEKQISLAPLLPVRKTFFENPYFDEDLTRINHRMRYKDAFIPKKWELKSEKEKIKKDDLVYSFVELFIYEQDDTLPAYPIRRHGETSNIRYYLIDFRNIFKINCDRIISSIDAPLESKCLQLSAQTRIDLMDKIIFYYSRVSEEDKTFDG